MVRKSFQLLFCKCSCLEYNIPLLCMKNFVLAVKLNQANLCLSNRIKMSKSDIYVPSCHIYVQITLYISKVQYICPKLWYVYPNPATCFRFNSQMILHISVQFRYKYFTDFSQYMALSIRPKIPRFPVRNWMERYTFWVHPLWWNFRKYRRFCVPFAKDIGFSLSTERRRSYDTVPCLPHSKGTAVFVFLAKLRTAQMNCLLDSAQCALLLVSITDTFP